MQQFKGLRKKIFAVLSLFSIIFNIFQPAIVVAQELSSPNPVESPTPAPSPSESPLPALSPSPEPSIEPSLSPVPSTSPLESIAPSPSPSLEPTPSLEPSISPSPSPTSTPESAITPSSSSSPAPSPSESPLPSAVFSPSPTPNNSFVPTIIPAPITGDLQATIVEQTAASSIEEFDLTINEEGSATLATDKLDYAPTDTALITGANFEPGDSYSLTISSTDDPATTSTVSVTADSDGKIFYAYQLDGVYRPNYKVEAKDASGRLVATITFTDSRSFDYIRVNGSSTVSVNPGDNIDVEVRIDTTGSDEANDWESTKYAVEGQLPICDNSPNYKTAGDNRVVHYDISAPTTVGTYDLTVTAYSDNDCSGEENSQTLPNAITVSSQYTVNTFSSNSYATPQNSYYVGSTVYGRATRTTSANLRLRYINPNGNVAQTCNYVNSTSTTCDYALPYDAPVGNWKLQIGRCDYSCNNNNNWVWTNYGEASFVVQSVTYTASYICHATKSDSNPYVLTPTSTIGQVMGHVGVGHQEGEDIVPPIPVLLPSGQNWIDGESIWNNNCDIPATTGSIKVVKTLVNNNGGNKAISDFPLFVGSTRVVSGVANTFAPGSYTKSFLIE